METLFKRHFWALELAALAISALLLGAGASRLVLARLAGFGVEIPPEGMATGGGRATDVPRIPETISEVGFPQPPEESTVDLCANTTCEAGQECNPTTGQCEAPEAEASADDDGPCFDSDIALTLSGTMVSEDPEWSLAVFQNPSTKKTEFARIGSELLAQAQVTAIYRSRVMISRNGRIECIRPAAVRAAAAARNENRTAPSATPAARPRPGSPAPVNTNVSPDELARTAVRRTGNNQYDIDKNAIESVLANPTALREQAPTVAPYYRDGKAAGFRLNGVRAGSMFSTLGIRNGDVIQSVNGQAMDSPQRAMELYQGLRTAGTIEMVVERGGRQQTITYNIR